MVRLKNRYLLVNILYPDSPGQGAATNVADFAAYHQPTTDSLTAQKLLKAIRHELDYLFGDYGAGAIADSLLVKYFSPATSTFILRVSRAYYRIAWAALSFMDKVPVPDGKKCVFRVVRVSGTIRKAEEEAIRRAREMILRARRELGEQSDAALEGLLGKDKDAKDKARDEDITMVDRSDSEEDELSDGDG